MSYTIVKKQYSPEPPPTRIIIPSNDSQGVPVMNGKRYYIKNNNGTLTSVKYADDPYDGYLSDSPMVVKTTPRANYQYINRSPNAGKQVYIDEYESDNDDNEVYYLIDGKYYKSVPAAVPQNPNPPVYVKQKPQSVPVAKENYVYYVNDRDSEEEYYDDVEEEVPYIQKKIVFARKPQPPKPQKVVYVDDERTPTVMESPRIYRVKSQSLIVRPNTLAVDSYDKGRDSKMKPLQKVIMANRASRPKRNHRKEIEKIEIRDKPLPNRSLIHGNSIVFK